MRAGKPCMLYSSCEGKVLGKPSEAASDSKCGDGPVGKHAGKGFDDFLSKSIEIDELWRILIRFLGEKGCQAVETFI